MEYFKSAFEIIFPTRDICFFCKVDEEIIYEYICKDCRKKLDIVNKEVVLDPLWVDRCFYTTIYDRFMKEIIKRFKFNDASYLYKPLAALMLSTIYKEGLDKQIDLVTFVPSHRRKEAIRGYNQTELLAAFISKKLNIPIFKGLLKVKITKDQHFLDGGERERNLSGAFLVKRKKEIKDKRILLIDDILTSGSTIQECSRVLKENEAKTIIALALTSSRKI